MQVRDDATGHMIFLAGVPAGTFGESFNAGQASRITGVFLQEHL